MSPSIDKIVLISKEGEKVVTDNRIFKYSEVLKNAPKLNDEINCSS